VEAVGGAGREPALQQVGDLLRGADRPPGQKAEPLRSAAAASSSAARAQASSWVAPRIGRMLWRTRISRPAAAACS
jgi:hypothetical protein